MYPAWDFRTIIEKNPTIAWKAAMREPFKDLILYWIETGRKEELKSCYEKGIYQGILKKRWLFNDLNAVDDAPEFFPCVLDGLRKVWLEFKFTSDKDMLYVDYANKGEDFKATNGEKMNVLNCLKDKFTIVIGDKQLGIIPSKRAREVYQKIFWLSSALES